MMKDMVRRLIFLAIVGLGIMTTAPANAATPAFGLDVQGRSRSIVMTVTFEPVPTGFAWTAFEESGVPEELLGVFPASAVDERGRPVGDAVPVLASLHRIEEGVYRAEVPVAQGRWAIVPWPLVSDFNPDTTPGAAPTVFVEVGDGTRSTASVAVAAVAGLGGLASVTWLFRKRKRTPQTPTRRNERR